MKKALAYAGIVVWFCGIVAAFALVWQYKSTPGASIEPPEVWPAAATIHPAAGMPNLLLFAHPQCPCTRASMAELSRIADALKGKAKIHVVLVRPRSTGPGFEDGAIADRAATVAGAEVLIDPGGEQADLFGAAVSGSTVLYSPEGKLLFRGGLTTARGHEGQGPAFDRILALASGGASERNDAPTFGCDLKEPIARAQ